MYTLPLTPHFNDFACRDRSRVSKGFKVEAIIKDGIEGIGVVLYHTSEQFSCPATHCIFDLHDHPAPPKQTST